MTADATSTAHPWRADWTKRALADKKLVLAGRQSKWEKERLLEWISREGGTVVDEVSPEVDLVVVVATAASPPPAAKKAEQLNKKGAAIEVLTLTEFCERIDFTGHEVLQMLRAGEAAKTRWAAHCHETQRYDLQPIVLPTSDLRGIDLSDFLLVRVRLHDVDLSGAKLERATLAALDGTKLDGAQLQGASIVGLSQCSLVGADLANAQISSPTPASSDFTNAKLTDVRFYNFASGASKFVSADLSGASLHSSVLLEADFTKANLQNALLRESQADGVSFAGANLAGAGLTMSSFKGADFRGANLRGANLFQSDLTDAQLDGADLTGANIAQAKLSAEQLAKTVGAPAAPRVFQPGPAFTAMEAELRNQYCYATLTVQTPQAAIHGTLSGQQSPHGLPSISFALQSNFTTHRSDPIPLKAPTVRQLFNLLLGVVGPDAVLQIQDLRAGNAISLDVWRDAVCEAFGVAVPTAEDLAASAAEEKARRAELKKTMLAELKGGAKGVQAFNARPTDDFSKMDQFAKADLKKANLDGLKVATWIDFSSAKFDGASLVNAEIGHTNWTKTSFTDATLRDSKIAACLTGAKFKNASIERVEFEQSEMSKTVFTGAKLSGCLFKQCSLLGADLSEATISDCRFVESAYNERTLFPSDFDASQLIWRGPGLPPHELAAEQAQAAEALASAEDTAGDGSGVDDVMRRTQRRDAFMTKVKQNLDKAKIDKALKMLKADKFELFVETKDDHLVGVVKSQSDPDLVYACRLASDGSYQCCTQNLNVCGGLRGSPCKHLLVLAIGLERNDAVPPEKLGLWIASSRNRQSALDKEKMGEVLLRYKGAQAGELDWRPTETTPEDFYAF